MNTISRRDAVKGIGLAAGSLGLGGCGGTSDEQGKSQPAPAIAAQLRKDAAPVVIVGFDGVDPRWVREWIDAGHLPNLAALAKISGVRDLESTIPPQSPVAWSTFATGTGPGEHGIFDIAIRNPRTYTPVVSAGKFEKPELNADGTLKTPAGWSGGRTGRSFWSYLDEAGLPSRVVSMAYDFPPYPMENGAEAAGLGTPDVRGTNSFFQAFDSNPELKKINHVPGGQIAPIQLNGDMAESVLEGPAHPTKPYPAKIELPIRFTRDTANNCCTVQIAEVSQTIPAGGWSNWYELSYPLSSQVTVKVICKVFVSSIEPHLRIYVSPQNMDPRAPMLPFATPEGHAQELAAKHGLYKTVGWIHDTNALRAGALDEDAFLEDAFASMDKRKEMLLRALEDDPQPFMLTVFTATDRISHMFYRFVDLQHPQYKPELAAKYGDVIRKTYQRMDDIVGEIMKRIEPGTKLMLLSDHGFHSFRYAFSINTWLWKNGYLVLKGQQEDSDPDFLKQKAARIAFLRGVDWERSRAYGLGLGQIYFNLKGREKLGIVEPGEEYQELAAEMKKKLLAETDPQTGKAVIDSITLRDEAFQGQHYDIAPDLQVGYAPGYQTDKNSVSGAIPEDILSPNMDPWSGDHACSDWQQTCGFMMSNFKFEVEKPKILDFAPTIMKYFGMEPPSIMSGKAWTLEKPA